MHAADIDRVSAAKQTQSPLDLFLIFVGANVVATTFQVGASLAASFPLTTAAAIVVAGSFAGAALVAALAPLGSRLRVPSVIAVRAALGVRGAGIVAAVLYLSNFAWIALNNVIAASAIARAAGGSQALWAIALGLLATAVVWRGPRAVARADRIAVPLMLLVGIALTVACLRAPLPSRMAPFVPLGIARGFDVVVGYQVSWILMFADYSRFTKSVRGSSTAVFVALAATSAWLMPLGAIAARAAGTSDPGEMLSAIGLGAAGALLLTLATVTTNFVNIYMSSLAWKSLMPRTSDGTVVWSIGIAGAAISALPAVWLDHYTNLMVLLGAVLVPVGGVLVAHFYFAGARDDDRVARALYDETGPYRGFSVPGLVSWAAGAATFFAMGANGGTIPALVVSTGVYLVAHRSVRL